MAPSYPLVARRNYRVYNQQSERRKFGLRLVNPRPQKRGYTEYELDFEWSKGGFGSVMLANFTVTNKSDHTFKDFTVKCIHSAPSGTLIG
jgi:hypothetical protein